MKREVIYSVEYVDFLTKSDERTQEKLLYVVSILENVQVLSAKFVKKLINTDFYELRVSVENEIRVIIFSADNENISIAQKIILLNAFVKKDKKDYNREVKKAMKILRRILLYEK